MTPHAGTLSVNGQARACRVELTDDDVLIHSDGAAIVALSLLDIDDVTDENYTLTLTRYTGETFALTKLGSAYGQLAEDISRARNEHLERALLLRGVSLQDTYPATLIGGGPVTLRLYEDLLVVVPEHGVMFGVPFSTIESVAWDQATYHVRVSTDDGDAVVLGKLAKRSEEFCDELRRLLDALARRTTETLSTVLPRAQPSHVAALATLMRDGRAASEHAIDTAGAELWGMLADAVTGTPKLRAAYDTLYAMCPPGSAAFGIKARLTESADTDVAQAEADTDVAQAEADDDGAVPGGGVTDMWYFCPLSIDGRAINAVAQEVTSKPGRATYVFRLMEPERFAALTGDALAKETARAIAGLNRALLFLSFRREPLYVPEEEIIAGRYSRYRVALRVLPYLRSARAALIGRAIHNATWPDQILALARKA